MMNNRGCTSYIFGGLIKGAIMGGVLGACVGFTLTRDPGIAVHMAASMGTCFGVVKAIVGALVC